MFKYLYLIALVWRHPSTQLCCNLHSIYRIHEHFRIGNENTRNLNYFLFQSRTLP